MTGIMCYLSIIETEVSNTINVRSKFGKQIQN